MLRLVMSLIVVAGCGGAPAPAPAPAMVPPVQTSSPLPPAPRAAPALSLAGTWTGVLAGHLHVALTVVPTAAGFDAVLESIDQGSKLPVDRVTLVGAAVHFDIAAVHGNYEGTLVGDHLDGTWTQGGAAMPLALVRGAAVPATAEPTQATADDAWLEVFVPKPPAPLRADDHTHLVYELHVANASPGVVSLARLEVTAAGHTLATFDAAALAGMIAHPGIAEPLGDERVAIGPRRLAIVFVWITLAGPVPATLEHRLTVKVDGGELAVGGPTIAVSTAAPRVVGEPLRGGPWLAGNGPSNTSGHRRALIPVAGTARIAQRFAIDWVKLGDDGKTFTGDPKVNASYHAYGEHALAVADGVVTEVKDGIVENVPGSRAIPITVETAGGNHVIVDLGGGRFAFWAHLQPGSIAVKVGDRVKAGQLIGLVGNSGNSSEPHLHFHVTDASSPLGSEGVPYAFAHFTVHAKGKPDQARAKQLPTDDEVVTFP